MVADQLTHLFEKDGETGALVNFLKTQSWQPARPYRIEGRLCDPPATAKKVTFAT